MPCGENLRVSCWEEDERVWEEEEGWA